MSLVTDPELPDYYVVAGRGTAAQVFDWILGHWHEHDIGPGIVEDSGGESIGIAGFKLAKVAGREYLDMGMTLRPAWQGRGVGASIARALLRGASEQTRPICAHTTAENLPALALLRKLGFERIDADEIEIGGRSHRAALIFRWPGSEG